MFIPHRQMNAPMRGSCFATSICLGYFFFRLIVPRTSARSLAAPAAAQLPSTTVSGMSCGSVVPPPVKIPTAPLVGT